MSSEPALPRVAWAMLMRHAREKIERIGARLDVPVVFLKAAWADPVLYGNRGERAGTDVDVLVPPGRFQAFAQALQAEGYRHFVPRGYTLTERYGSHAWAFVCDGARGEPVIDLHRGLTDYWCRVDSAALIKRARCYESPDGPVRGLAPEDQVLHALIHHLNHAFDLDGRHAEDIVRLAERFPIDWMNLAAEVRAAGLSVPYALLCEFLRAHGVAIPASVEGGPLYSLRVDLARRWLTDGRTLQRKRKPTTTVAFYVDFAARALLLSNRWSATLPRMGRYALLRAADGVLGMRNLSGNAASHSRDRRPGLE